MTSGFGADERGAFGPFAGVVNFTFFIILFFISWLFIIPTFTATFRIVLPGTEVGGWDILNPFAWLRSFFMGLFYAFITALALFLFIYLAFRRAVHGGARRGSPQPQWRRY